MPAGCDNCAALAAELLIVQHHINNCSHTPGHLDGRPPGGEPVEECIGGLYARFTPTSPAPGCGDCAAIRSSIDTAIRQAVDQHPPHRAVAAQQSRPALRLVGGYRAHIAYDGNDAVITHRDPDNRYRPLIDAGKALWATECRTDSGERLLHTATASTQRLDAADPSGQIELLCGLVTTGPVAIGAAAFDPFAWDDDPAIMHLPEGWWLIKATPTAADTRPRR